MQYTFNVFGEVCGFCVHLLLAEHRLMLVAKHLEFLFANLSRFQLTAGGTRVAGLGTGGTINVGGPGGIIATGRWRVKRCP